jgi:hypothetical protein
MRNKVTIGIVIALIIIVGGAAVYNVLNGNKSNPNQILSTASNNSKVSTSELATITACDVLTEDTAKSILGDTIDHQDPSLGSANTADLSVSSCIYSTKVTTTSTATAPKSSGINLLARIALTQTGAESNKSQFEGLGAGQQEIKNLGDKAFYAAAFRQINVLKNNNWYIVTYYKDTATNANLDTDKQLAEKIQYK